MDLRRVKILKDGIVKSGPVVYWMSRDQRVQDNWALIHAQNVALQKKVPLIVIFCLVDDFLGAQVSHFEFMLSGLKKVAKDLIKRNISFYCLVGKPDKEIIKFSLNNNVSVLITDFDPLITKISWKEKIKKEIKIPFFEVDAHNIVPSWVVSNKMEYAAYTFRPKILKLLNDFLIKIPKLKIHPYGKSRLEVSKNFSQYNCLNSGEDVARKELSNFIKLKLNRYFEDKNDPSLNGQSNLSRYLHFGQLSTQRVALEVTLADVNIKSRDNFLEELVVRRELADNFCLYNKNYDNIKCLPGWASNSLSLHSKDQKDYIYTLKDFEQARTHDKYWNAAQLEMVTTGKMHGYMRMYWGKKIIEWTESPIEAYNIIVYLNNKYELDGRDPNGYAGIAWCFGMHDRPWGKRSVFGSVRYMNAQGLKRKFNIANYVSKFIKEG